MGVSIIGVAGSSAGEAAASTACEMFPSGAALIILVEVGISVVGVGAATAAVFSFLVCAHVEVFSRFVFSATGTVGGATGVGCISAPPGEAGC